MAFINSYRKSMPFPKMILEDFRYRILWAINYYKNNQKVKTALFYPNFPSKRSVLYKVFRELNYNITNNPRNHYDVAIYWDDATYRVKNEEIINISLKKTLINTNSLDISKSNVDKIFSEVAGYSSLLNSKIHKGLMVKKNEINAKHDGKIIQGPVDPEHGFVYQKLINNQCDEGLVEDMRIPYLNGTIPLVFLKYKTLPTRFGLFKKYHSKIKKVKICMLSELLSNEEIDTLISFCKSSGLDYGELDVLRDRDTNKIYVVDVNNTPAGPPYMDKRSTAFAIKTITESFRNEFLETKSFSPLVMDLTNQENLHRQNNFLH